MTKALADKLTEVEARQRAGIETTPKTRSLFDAVRAQEIEFRKAFPKSVDPGRFVRLALTTLRTVPHLLECSEASIMAGFMQAAQLGVEIDQVRGQAFLIPRWSSKLNGYEATFQLGYRGIVDIAGRSGVKCSVRDVCEKDLFEFEDGLTPKLRHIPKLDGDRGQAVAFFAIARFSDGSDPEFLVMGRADIDKVRDQFGPRTKNGKLIGPWADPSSYPGMARKTVLLRLLNYLPLPVEVVDAIRDEESPVDVRDSLPDPALPPAAPPAPAAGAPGEETSPPSAADTSDTAAAPAEGTTAIVDALERSLDGDTVDDAPPPEE